MKDPEILFEEITNEITAKGRLLRLESNNLSA